MKKYSTAPFYILPFALLVLGCLGCPQAPTPTSLTLFSSSVATQAVSYPYTFVVLGDSRKCHPLEKLKLKDVDQTRELIIKKMVELKPDFVINAGDFVLKGSAVEDWQEFDRFNSIFRERNIAYYPVLGNHEYKGNKNEALDNYFKRFPDINHQKWYTFRRGNSAFIILDSNFDELTKDEFNQQQQWLRDTLTKCELDPEISFVYSFMHHPPYTNSKIHKPDKIVQTNFIPLFEQSSKTKFVFCSHHHSYERFKVKGINYIVTGGGGAPLMKELEPEDGRYHDEYGSGKPRGTHFCLLSVGQDKVLFKTLHIDPDKLTWQEGDFCESP